MLHSWQAKRVKKVHDNVLKHPGCCTQQLGKALIQKSGDGRQKVKSARRLFSLYFVVQFPPLSQQMQQHDIYYDCDDDGEEEIVFIRFT